MATAELGLGSSPPQGEGRGGCQMGDSKCTETITFFAKYMQQWFYPTLLTGTTCEILKAPDTWVPFVPIQSGSLGMGSGHQCFVRVPQMILMCSQIETTALEKVIRSGRY